MLSSVYLGGGACAADEAAVEYGRLPACAVASVTVRDLDRNTIGRLPTPPPSGSRHNVHGAGAEALDAYDLFFPGCHYHPLYELPRLSHVTARSWRQSGRGEAKAFATCLNATDGGGGRA